MSVTRFAGTTSLSDFLSACREEAPAPGGRALMGLFRAYAHIQLLSFSQHHGLVKLETVDCIPIRLVPDIATLPDSLRSPTSSAPDIVVLIGDLRRAGSCDMRGLRLGKGRDTGLAIILDNI